MKQNISLSTYNTFGFDVKARFFERITSIDDLWSVLKKYGDKPKLILGGGSNVLFINDFDGVVLYNDMQGKEIVSETDNTIRIKVMGGENWHDLVMWAVENNYGGIENLALIPGKAGTAPMQNIGAYGVEVKDVIEQVNFIDMQTGKSYAYDNKDCDFGYRHSVFKQPENKGKFYITSVVLQLTKNQHRLRTQYGAIQQVLAQKHIVHPNIKDIAEAVIEIRRSKLPDPKQIGNAGSFFKNPFIEKTTAKQLKGKYPDMPVYQTDIDDVVKIPAGWLIDRAGWKGKRFGQVGVHDKQALVLVNYGGGTGLEIKKLAENIILDVKNKYGIALTPEVNFY